MKHPLGFIVAVEALQVVELRQQSVHRGCRPRDQRLETFVFIIAWLVRNPPAAAIAVLALELSLQSERFQMGGMGPSVRIDQIENRDLGRLNVSS